MLKLIALEYECDENSTTKILNEYEVFFNTDFIVTVYDVTKEFGLGFPVAVLETLTAEHLVKVDVNDIL